ncbi:hypothetical protein Tco_1303991 [Tanacetum coccineum]
MEGQSSHASVNPNSGANTSSDAGTGIRCTNGDMAWEWGEWKDPKKRKYLVYTLWQENAWRDHKIYQRRGCGCGKVKGNVSKKRKSVGASNVRGPLDSILKIDHGNSKQSTLDKNNPIKQNLKMVAWKKIATWAYTVGLPFNAVRDESFQDMIYAIGEYGRDGKGRSLINFLVDCPTGTIFLKSIDASKHVKDAQLIVKMINEVIEDVGEENILQVPAHCVNLMIGDIGEKIPKIKSALGDARAVVVYIYNHGRVLNMMRKLTKNKELHRSCVTRFATQLYTLKSVHENRHHLQVLFVSEQWTKSDLAKKPVGKRVERIVAKQEFWDNVYLACQVLAPLVDLVRLVDMEEKACMGYIYDVMTRAKDQISKNLKGKPNERLVSRVWSMIQTRWTDQFHHPLHAAGCFLDPAIFHEENSKVSTNNEILTDDNTRGKFIPEDPLVRYTTVLESEPCFSSLVAAPFVAQLQHLLWPSCSIWWRSYGIDTPLLQRFAITVLSQTCSASPCERNWSAFDNLHSKKRNCLLQQKLNDLVFIQYNTRLRRRFESIKTNKSLDPILLRDVEENDEWMIPTENELQDFVNAGDGLLWSDVREAMGGNVDIGPSTRSKRERYRDDDDEISVGGGLEEEVNALDDVDSDAEPLDCN